MTDISNEDLKKVMAMQVMRWTIVKIHREYYWYTIKDAKQIIRIDKWNPPTDLNQAMQCVEKLHKESYIAEFSLDFNYGNYGIFTSVKCKGKYYKDCMDKSPARAICLALKNFVEDKMIDKPK